MIMKNKENKVMNGEKEKSFFEKYKSDPRYKAKVQLTTWGIFIAIIVIVLNIASMTKSSRPISNTVTPIHDTKKDESKLGEWLDQIGDNYEYEVDVSIKKDDDSSDSVKYLGKSYDKRLTIDRVYQGNTLHYQKEIDKYYSYVNENTYEEINEEDIYSLVKAEYVSKEGLQNFLENASLDHVTDYSNGKKEYEYHLKVRDMIKTYMGDDEITFQVVEENEKITIDVDYALLLKQLSFKYTEVKVTYLYQNIGKVEEIQAINENHVKKDEGNE